MIDFNKLEQSIQTSGQPNDILFATFFTLSNASMLEIINDFRVSIDDPRSVYPMAEFDELFKFKKPSEIVEMTRDFDSDAPYFEYDGVNVVGMDEPDDSLGRWDETDELIKWLVENDRWETYDELAMRCGKYIKALND